MSQTISSPKGPLLFKLTNDYMFRAVFQQNQKVLKALIAALLHLDISKINSIKILNPIVLGEDINAKTVVLDLLIRFNDDRIINIEMQVSHYDYWTARSIYYLCKAYTSQLERGKNYEQLLPVIHVGICDFTPPGLPEEFYGIYSLRNERNFELYSSQIQLNVLNLTQMNKALPGDADLLKWAQLFKASSWEELQTLSSNDQNFMEVCDTMYALSQDEKIRLQCFARERYEHDMASAIYAGEQRGMQKGLLARQAELDALTQTLNITINSAIAALRAKDLSDEEIRTILHLDKLP